MRNALKEQRLVDKFNCELGPALLSYLSDKQTQEIMVNPDGRIWIDHQEAGLYPTADMMDSITAKQLIGSIAELSGTIVNEENPILETELPFSTYRFAGVIPPLVKAPSFSIRKHSKSVFSLEDYVNQKILTAHQAKIIKRSLNEKMTLLITGGPGTGKTTFANAILNEMYRLSDHYQRFILIEDTQELQCNAPNTLALKTTEGIDHDRLLKASLRLRPDILCVGECRGKEMLTLLKAWNTGTRGGIATIHANSTQSALLRVVEMAEESGSTISPYLVCESIQLIVSIALLPNIGRRITEIKCLRGYQEGQYVLEDCC